jgi:hypothetical protein
MSGLGTGKRFDEGKIRYDLIPPFANEQLASVLTMGANKYGDNNWKMGMNWSKVIASLKRHLAEIEKGNDYDEESGLLHSAHVLTNAVFLTEYYKIYPQGDDRFKKYNFKIGLDIDEVICDWIGSWIKLWEMDVPDSWFFDGKINKRFTQLKDEGKLEEFYANLEPRINPKELSFEPHCYITSRPVDTSITVKWLEKHGFPIRPVYTVGLGQSKVQVAKDSGLDVFVDDRYDNFVELNSHGICTYLMDTPHNKRYDVGYKRLYNLNSLVE